MASVTSDLKLLRQQVESLQAEVAGRKAIGAMVVWDKQNDDSVNQKEELVEESFNGLIVHLSLEPDGLAHNEFIKLREEIRDSLAASSR